MFAIIFNVIAVVGFVIHVVLDRHRPRTLDRVLELALLWVLGTLVGLAGVVAAFFHIFFAQTAAASIGWSTSPFQFENAVGDLGVGVAALVSLWQRGKFMAAVIVVASIQLFGDAIGHVYQLVVNHDTATDNAGGVLVSDFAVPALIVILGVVLWARANRTERRATLQQEPAR